MPFLPEKFAGAKERARGFFPAHYVAPLIDFQRKIAVRLHPFGIHAAYNRFRGGADHQRLGKRFAAAHRYHRHFRREPLYVFRFFGEKTHGNKQRKISVFHALRLKALIHFALNVLPYRVRVRADHHRTLYGTVIHHFRL